MSCHRSELNSCYHVIKDRVYATTSVMNNEMLINGDAMLLLMETGSVKTKYFSHHAIC